MPVLGRRELGASILTAVLVGLYLVFLAVGNFLTGREMTALALLLTGAVILLLTGDGDEQPWFSTALAVAAVVCAALSFTLSPVLLLTMSIATTSTLWSVHLAEHVTFAPPEETRHDHHGSDAAARRRR